MSHHWHLGEKDGVEGYYECSLEPCHYANRITDEQVQREARP